MADSRKKGFLVGFQAFRTEVGRRDAVEWDLKVPGFKLSCVTTVTAVPRSAASRAPVCRPRHQRPTSTALGVRSRLKPCVSPRGRCSGMWSIPSRKLHHQQHCLWMLTLMQGQATLGAVTLILWPSQDLALLEPFQVWEVVTSRKALPSAWPVQMCSHGFTICLCQHCTLWLFVWWKQTERKLRCTLWKNADNNMHVEHVGLLWGFVSDSCKHQSSVIIITLSGILLLKVSCFQNDFIFHRLLEDRMTWRKLSPQDAFIEQLFSLPPVPFLLNFPTLCCVLTKGAYFSWQREYMRGWLK